jgi:hypothetical protein
MWARATPNVINIEKRGRPAPPRTSPTWRSEGEEGGCPADAKKGEEAEGKEGDATPNLLLKHSYATLATYI